MPKIEKIKAKQQGSMYRVDVTVENDPTSSVKDVELTVEYDPGQLRLLQQRVFLAI